jgi:hypothetical protein
MDGLLDRWVHPPARRLFHPTRTTCDPFQKPANEKSISVTLPPQRYDNWLQASAKVSGDLLRAWLSELMEAGQILNR